MRAREERRGLAVGPQDALDHGGDAALAIGPRHMHGLARELRLVQPAQERAHGGQAHRRVRRRLGLSLHILERFEEGERLAIIHGTIVGPRARDPGSGYAILFGWQPSIVSGLASNAQSRRSTLRTRPIPATISVDGEAQPKELTHAGMLTAWIERLRPDASEALLLAARAHHLRRWESPRDGYPRGRRGYLRWRRELQRLHAAYAAEILEEVGYDAESIGAVQRLIRKESAPRRPRRPGLRGRSHPRFHRDATPRPRRPR